MVSHRLERAIGHANLRLQDGETLLGQLSRNIMVGHRAKQAAVYASFLGQLDGGTAELCTLGLRLGQFGSGDFFKFGAFDLKFLDGRCSRAAGTAGRNQKIARITVFDLDDFTQIAQVDDFVEQNNLLGVAP